MQIPLLKLRNYQKRTNTSPDLITKNPSPELSEAFKTARTNMMYTLSDIEGGKCVIITSSIPSEGKTTTCINLAISSAQTESRVLLVDADMRRPRIHSYLNIKNKKGLADLLGGFASLDDVLLHIDELNLDCITAGNLPPNPVELMSSKKMKDFIATVAEQYDYILFDAPPVNLVADASALARLVKNVVFICKRGYSSTTEMEKALSSLKFAGAKVLGFIFIDADTKKKKAKKYSGYYYE